MAVMIEGVVDGGDVGGRRGRSRRGEVGVGWSRWVVDGRGRRGADVGWSTWPAGVDDGGGDEVGWWWRGMKGGVTLFGLCCQW